VGVRFGSGGSGWIGLRPVAGVAGAELPRRRRAGTHRSSPNLVLQGSNRPVLGSGMLYTAHVIYWRPRLGSGRSVETESWTGAELHDGARRCACSGCENGLLSTTSSAKGPGERRAAHRGLSSGVAAAQGGRRRWRAAEMGRRSRKKLL
jgi:hypothetical protein